MWVIHDSQMYPIATLKRPLKTEERIEWMQRVAQASVLTAQLGICIFDSFSYKASC